MIEYKGYMIEGDGTFGMKRIKPIGKGSVNMSLRDSYTTYEFAKQAIDTFEAEKEHGKTKKSSGGKELG
jgi:hypothetical protein